MSTDNRLKHGGNIGDAAKTYGQSESDWLDLSTGISPWTYPIPEIPDKIWRSLPYQNDSFWQVAANYYRVTPEMMTAVAGSQDAIRRIPALVDVASVAIPYIGYKEHEHSWRQAGHEVYIYRSWQELNDLLDKQLIVHCVVINPNNPSAEYIDNTRMETIYQRLSGYLVVDEAFMDVDEKNSFIPYLHNNTDNRLIILRSLGKFFGLAGLRLGFALGQGKVIEKLRGQVYPWAVNYPALYIAESALANVNWQQQQKTRIYEQENQVVSLLKDRLPQSCNIVSAGLFVSIFGQYDQLMPIYQKAASQAILLRDDQLQDQDMWLRVGLPGDDMNRLVYFMESL